MNSETWERIKDVYAAALEQEPARRAAFLDSACATDVDVREHVESLLEADAQAGDFLAEPEDDASGRASHFLAGDGGGAACSNENNADAAGTRIDRYELIEPLGEGGFGIVYRAAQQEPVRREAALKLIKPGMDTRQVIARFESERQALALMDHPCIARVLDAGATTLGRPYFVMELVDGAPITEFCARRGLSIAARLALFLRVCDAVQHAHQKGIIHRDLKPSNVLVTELDGAATPKVIDFGVAKALHARLTEQTLTEAWRLVGTPAYMSPEQVDAEADVDTRADVYSLGAMLYELLAGSAPFESRRLRDASYSELVRIIRDVEPPPLTAHNARLRGDLEWIVAKAIEKDRDRRYDTVSALAADIRRHLDDEPVLAGPPSATYRFGKLMRRHRGLITASGVALGALVAGLGVAVVGFAQASAARDKAQRARDDAQKEAAAAEQSRKEAEAINAFMTDMLLQADPASVEGRDLRLSEVLDAAAAQVPEMAGDAPTVEASLRRTIGRTYSMIGRNDEALEHLRRALALREQSGDEESVEYVRAQVDLGATLEHAGQFDEAEKLADAAIDTLRGGEVLASALLARALDLRGHVMLGTSRYDAAEEDLEAAIALYRGIEGEAGPMGRSLAALGSTLMRRARLPEAEATLREALEISEHVHGENGAHTADVLSNLAVTLRRAGKLQEAAAAYRRAYEVQWATHGELHPATVATLMNLGSLQTSLHEYREAEQTLREANEKVRVVHGETSYQYAIAQGLLSRVLAAQDRLDEAAEAAQIALDTCRAALGPEHEYTATCSFDLGTLQLMRGDLAPAEASFDEAARIYRAVLGESHPHAARVLEKLAEVAYRRGDREAGAVRYAEARAMYAATLGDNDREVADCDSSWAKIERDYGDLGAAAKLFQRARVLRIARGEAESPAAVDDQIGLGACLVRMGDDAAAESAFMIAYETAIAGGAGGAKLAGESAANLAALFEARGDERNAAEWRQRAQPLVGE